jgi:hypothetical protein
MNLTEVAEKYSQQHTPEVKKEIDESLSRKLLPIEMATRLKITEHNQSIQRNNLFKKYDEKFKIFDPSCLKMKKYNKELKMIVPMFAVYDVNGDTEFRVSQEVEYNQAGTLAKIKTKSTFFEEHFQNIMKIPLIAKYGFFLCRVVPVMLVVAAIITSGVIFLPDAIGPGTILLKYLAIVVSIAVGGFTICGFADKHFRSIHRSNIRTQFTGVIPDEARDLIKNNAKDFDKILLISEANQWSTDKIIIPPQPVDPLIIGRKEIAGVIKYYLIGQFDPTPIEVYVNREFSVKN